MPARRRTIPSPATRRPKVAGTAAPGRPETDGEGPTLTGVRGPRPPASVAARVRTQPAGPVADAPVADAPSDAAVADAPAGPAGDPASVDPAEPTTGADPATTPRGRRRSRPAAGSGDPAEPTGTGRGAAVLSRLRTMPVLAALLVVLVALSVFFGIATAALRSSPSAANTALTDLTATSEVSTQLGDALELLYSYDFARLDENERAARDVITEGFTPEFDRLFTQVRELAPQQQAVVSAVVTVSAVQSIEGDTAVLVAFMDQQASTAASTEQVAAAGRLTVTGERVDGRWRIASVESR
ncbi:nuclear transport factor 2 family protein [Pseudonocardia abyssalis]|uniref:Nuclear transport factor 2 family protein n=1 Tax=Pseudonocardia abyssalis TaxID=2792008 RepID=A0ABS6V0N0_9PSEU|nr:nuclear transport factor 2 family protein [Pseudonocardia abyssalis]MBW0117818.1 nuclear transport factor 2 family protein [Pseudonocardia abyssalis]MBW0138046.1 nuclear transport factor 2 family protein [Pseudonocardia abyssalis]